MMLMRVHIECTIRVLLQLSRLVNTIGTEDCYSGLVVQMSLHHIVFTSLSGTVHREVHGPFRL